MRRAHAVDEKKGHGFIDSQRAGTEVFKQLPPDAPLIVVEGVWQYSHHVLAGLHSHRGPILVVNWSGEFPGLVGLLNLTGSLTKAGVPYAALWSEDFTDEWARDGLRTWLETGTLTHDTTHVRDLPALPADAETELGVALASVVEVPEEETRRRLDATTPEWPIMHAVLHGVTRDQFMARHKANHLNVAYAPDAATADKALRAKASLFEELGLRVHLCGDVSL
ncbi:hypothetical protein [Streptomyces aureus]|uniref:Fucose isomerase n=1 Tax=Streptomyces aureus TaxID=193461 RepID=A0ABV4SSZ9_9ACTN